MVIACLCKSKKLMIVKINKTYIAMITQLIGYYTGEIPSGIDANQNIFVSVTLLFDAWSSYKMKHCILQQIK